MPGPDTMLLQFSVANHRSFRDPAVMSLVDPVDAARPALREAILFGANASGKSGLLDALRLAQWMIVTGPTGDEPIPIVPFAFEPGSHEKGSEFQFDIRLDGARYSYGFVVTATAVLEEWLYLERRGVQHLMFSRKRGKQGRALIRIGAGARPKTTKGANAQKDRLTFVAEGTRANQLFLTKAANDRVDFAEVLFAWFHRDLRVENLYGIYPGLAHRLEQDPAFRAFAASLMQHADVGIFDLKTERSAFPAEADKLLQTTMRPAARKEFYRTIERTPVSYGHMDLGYHEGAPSMVEVKFEHRHVPGTGTLPYASESRGTQRLLHLAPFLYDLTREGGGNPVVVIDEIDTHLHPLLVRSFIETFDVLSRRHGRGQLICATHDTTLLSAPHLTPGAFWFVEKDREGVSRLHSLAEYDPRQIEALHTHLDGGYLAGRFGAIPRIGRDGVLVEVGDEREGAS